MNIKNKSNLSVHTSDFSLEDRKYAETFECVFCKIVSPNNYCLNCNHCICEYCISRYKNYQTCPIDGNQIIENNYFQNDLIGKALLNNLKIKCIFNSEGCQWIGIYKDFQSIHLSNCKYFSNNKSDNISINNEIKDKKRKNNSSIFKRNKLNIKKEKVIFNKEELEKYYFKKEYIYFDIENENNNNQNSNELLNKKRKILIEEDKNDNILINKKSNFNNNKSFEIEKRQSEPLNIYKNNNISIEIEERQSEPLNFYKNNNTFNEEMILPDDNSEENN